MFSCVSTALKIKSSIYPFPISPKWELYPQSKMSLKIHRCCIFLLYKYVGCEDPHMSELLDIGICSDCFRSSTLSMSCWVLWALNPLMNFMYIYSTQNNFKKGIEACVGGLHRKWRAARWNRWMLSRRAKWFPRTTSQLLGLWVPVPSAGMILIFLLGICHLGFQFRLSTSKLLYLNS